MFREGGASSKHHWRGGYWIMRRSLSSGRPLRAGPLADDDRSVLSPPPLHPPRQVIEIDLELLRLADFVLELGDIVGRELRRRLAGGFDHELNLRGVFQHDR